MDKVGWKDSPAVIRTSSSSLVSSSETSVNRSPLNNNSNAMFQAFLSSSPMKSPLKKKHKQTEETEQELEELNLDDVYDDFMSEFSSMPNEQQSKEKPRLVEDDDLFKDLSDSDFLNIENNRTYIELEVVQVELEKNVNFFEKRLKCKERDNQVYVSVILKDSWIHTRIEPNMKIHLVDPGYENDSYVISSVKGLVVIFPDLLINATSLCDSFSCLRRAFLSFKIQDAYASNLSLVTGSFIHSLFEKALKQFFIEQDPRDLSVFAKELNSKYFEEMFSANVNQETFTNLVNEALTRINQTRIFKQLDELVEIEESITSLALGIKGIIDAVVRYKNGLAPFELKTGMAMNNNISHRAQTTIYSTLMQEKYGKIDTGLLFYLKNDSLVEIPVLRNETVALIMGRNVLAQAISCNELPQPINNEFICEKCFQKENCLVFNKVYNEEPLLIPSYNQVLKEMNSDHEMFLKKWLELLDLEEKEISKRGKKQFHGFTLHKVDHAVNHFSLVRDNIPLLFNPGDAIKLLKNNSVISMGFIVEINDNLLVSLDSCPDTKGTFTLEKNEISINLNFMRSCLISLCKSDTKLRQLIVDYKEPKFSVSSVKIPQELLFEFHSFNPNQQQAIISCIQAQDYALILGMPGTGKTTAIVFFIKFCILNNFSVLVSSHTHNCVDNILLKLIDQGINVLRIGTRDKIHERLFKFTKESKDFKSLQELTDFYMNSSLVVGATCYAMKEAIFQKRKFDYCIIDEASQVLFPSTLGPLLISSKFILIGDYYQLPPLVKSNKAKDLGLSSSLFEILCFKFKNIVAKLALQYRMNQEILKISNRFIYFGLLECANDETRFKQLDSEHYKAEISMQIDEWMRFALDPLKPVVFLDTDLIQDSKESLEGNSNPCQVELIKRLNLKFEQVFDLKPAVLVPFGAQLRLLNNFCDVHTIDRYQGKDSDIVIISFVRSNKEKVMGELLTDYKRLNVAFTRAKKKLVMIGSLQTMESEMKDFVEMIKENHWNFSIDPTSYTAAQTE